ncbi:hypothetical protein [Hyphococcus sp.]|uniref:hypothetical protein n=1 Tax=Hyphococcus sp. TaxID=2038636 RepID=UPI00208142B5|nr:MAG: hypothetical protein DHS20C04_30770 [Marinicaulis sp.]
MTLETIVSAPVVRPVLVGLLDFADDPVYGHTGNGVLAISGTGDPDLDGNLFAPAEGAVSVTDFVENMGNGEGITLTFAAPDVDADVIKQIVRDGRQWILRKAKVWIFFQKANEAELEPFYRQLFGGVMVKAKTSRAHNEPGVIVIDCDTDYALAEGSEARLQDHGRFVSGDGFSSFILDLVNGLIASVGGALSGAANVGGGKRASGGGAKYSYER